MDYKEHPTYKIGSEEDASPEDVKNLSVSSQDKLLTRLKIAQDEGDKRLFDQTKLELQRELVDKMQEADGDFLMIVKLAEKISQLPKIQIIRASGSVVIPKESIENSDKELAGLSKSIDVSRRALAFAQENNDKKLEQGAVKKLVGELVTEMKEKVETEDVKGIEDLNRELLTIVSGEKKHEETDVTKNEQFSFFEKLKVKEVEYETVELLLSSNDPDKKKEQEKAKEYLDYLKTEVGVDFIFFDKLTFDELKKLCNSIKQFQTSSQVEKDEKLVQIFNNVKKDHSSLKGTSAYSGFLNLQKGGKIKDETRSNIVVAILRMGNGDVNRIGAKRKNEDESRAERLGLISDCKKQTENYFVKDENFGKADVLLETISTVNELGEERILSEKKVIWDNAVKAILFHRELEAKNPKIKEAYVDSYLISDFDIMSDIMKSSIGGKNLTFNMLLVLKKTARVYFEKIEEMTSRKIIDVDVARQITEKVFA